MTMDTICLQGRPMPYMTECSMKRFNINEYHCARYLTHFVLIFMMHNQLTFEENGTPVTLHAGEWYLQRKDMHQSASSPSPSAEYMFIHFQGAFSPSAYDGLVLPIRGRYDIQTYDVPLKELYHYANRSPMNQFEAQQRFIGLLGLLHHTASKELTLSDKVLQYINIHFTEHITSQSLSETFAYCTEYIERQVKDAIGMTPHAYLVKKRLEHAKRQLERSSASIAQISEDCGYTDASLFFRAFKKEYGLSPSMWRKNTQAIKTSPALAGDDDVSKK